MATSFSKLPSKETWAAHGRRWKFLLLLLPGFYTASMDLTVVATAQPFIASHFSMYHRQETKIPLLIIRQML
jgi:hypothetical protein